MIFKAKTSELLSYYMEKFGARQVASYDPYRLVIYSCWPNSITIYRGAKSDEKVPGVSWTLDRKIAENEFYDGKLWEAVIDKKDVLAYFSKDETEEEIVTNVTAGFRELDV